MKKIYFFVFLIVYTFRLFSQNYTVLGNASQLPQCKCYQLTPNSGNQAGAIFQNNTINLNNSFDYTFTNFFGCNGSSGADGEAFVLTSNPNGLGNPGGGLGYQGSNQPCSFAIEFDTWQNSNQGDPAYDHTAYESGGSGSHNVVGPVSALASQSNLDNCQWHTIRVVWNVNTQTMSDYVDGTLRISQVLSGLVSNYLCNNPVVNWGWTGSTGGGWNLQQVCIQSISSWVAGVNYQSCSPTVPFSDISTSNVGSVQSWAWTFGDGSTSTLQNPTHTYADTGTFTASLIITDVSGCADTFSHPVHIVNPIVLTPSLTNPACNGGLNGSISLTEAGGFGASTGHGGFTYTWSNNTNGPTDAGIGAGTYAVTATDGVCSATGQYTLNQPSALSATTSSTAASCGQPTGSASITITGGTPPYQNVTWAGQSGTTTGNTTTVSNLSAGTYIANFQDANSCSALLQYTTTIAALPCGVHATASSTNVNCYGQSTGTATLSVTGNTGTPTITWTSGGNPAGSGATINNLPAGTYTYTYSDNDNTHGFTGTVVVTQPAHALAISLDISNIACAGMSNGQAIASVDSGGRSPYTYTWSPTHPNNPIASNLPAGAISVIVSDSLGCTATAAGNVVSSAPLQLNITTIDNACSQYNNGSATAHVTGGTPSYYYDWSNISSAQTDLSLAGGTYTLTVTDSLGCSITGTATIATAPAFVNTIDSTNVRCHGDTTGSITVNSSGGTSPYAYSWSSDTLGDINPALTGANLVHLKAGEYLLTVTDAHNCTFYDSVFIKQPTTALTVSTTTKNVTCFGANNGSIAITLSGGTAPYAYSGLPGIPIPPGTDTIKNLKDSVYIATISDANGCSVTITDTVKSPGPQSIVVTETDNTCNGGHAGTATANFVNPTGAVAYNWSNLQTGATISNLDSATYNVTATDASNCSFTGTTTVSQPAAVAMTISVANPNCYGNKGLATATPNGGNAPFVYTWSAGGSTTNTDSVAVGNYTVFSTDLNSCRQTAAFSVSQPTALTLQATQTNVNCYGGNTGSITLTPAGGTGATYTYTWNPNVSTTNTAANLLAGAYNISVADQNGCVKDTTLTITQPVAPLAAIYTVTNVACFGGSTGSIIISANGGTVPYTYNWSNNVTAGTGSTANNLAANTYLVTITDVNSCTIDTSLIITQPATALAIDSSHSDVSCNGLHDGVARVTATGGTTPYSYIWAGATNSTVDSATALTAGSYAVTVNDANSCSATLPYVITQPTLITPVAAITNVKCYGQLTGSIVFTTSGGAGGYTYTWLPIANVGDSANNIPAGTYTTTVTDATGCSVTATNLVTQPAAFAVDTSTTPVSCYGKSDGAISINVSGGSSPYNFTASNGGAPVSNTTGQFSNLVSGEYAVHITDQNGCPDSTAVYVAQPAALTDSIIASSPTCSYLNNGKITVLASGGNPAYIFADSAQTNTTGTFTSLAAGKYIIKVTDSKGCTISDSTQLIKPDSVIVTVDPVLGQVKLGATLQLTATTNQTGNITYTWTPNFGLSCYDCADPVFNGVYSQPYMVVVTNDSGCAAAFNFTVTVIPNYDFFLPNAFTPNGDGKNDYWQLFGNTGSIKQLEVMVFDRIGEKVFESNDIEFKWDGTFKGQIAPAGVYVYAVKIVWLDNHSDDTIKGGITLLK